MEQLQAQVAELQLALNQMQQHAAVQQPLPVEWPEEGINRISQILERGELRMGIRDQCSKITITDGVEKTDVRKFLRELELVPLPQRVAVFEYCARDQLLHALIFARFC
jgi:hypothetical protein